MQQVNPHNPQPDRCRRCNGARKDSPHRPSQSLHRDRANRMPRVAGTQRLITQKQTQGCQCSEPSTSLAGSGKSSAIQHTSVASYMHASAQLLYIHYTTFCVHIVNTECTQRIHLEKMFHWAQDTLSLRMHLLIFQSWLR